MIKKTGVALVLYLAVVAAAIIWAARIHTVLFHSAYGGLIAATAAGTVAGIISAVLKRRKRATAAGDSLPRHTVGSFMQHWGTGVGIVLLIVSGALIASGRRLWLIIVPEISHSRIMALNLHWVGAFFTLLFGCFFLADFLVSGGYKALVPGPLEIWNSTFKRYILRKSWTDKDKYLTSQKLAFLVFAVLGAIVLVTGVIKVHFFIKPFPVTTATNLHDISSELFSLVLVVHVVIAIAVPSHWRLFLSWFTGKEPRKR